VVARNVTVVAMVHRACMVAEGVPDGLALAIVESGTFYLI
jgi:hypothetical protein